MGNRPLRRFKCESCRKKTVVEIGPNENYFNRRTTCDKCFDNRQRKIRSDDYPKGFVNFLSFIFIPFGFYMNVYYKDKNKPDCAKSALSHSITSLSIIVFFLLLIKTIGYFVLPIDE